MDRNATLSRQGSDRTVNDLKSDFAPLGGVVTILPDVREVADQSLYVLKTAVPSGTTYKLYMMVEGTWKLVSTLT